MITVVTKGSLQFLKGSEESEWVLIGPKEGRALTDPNKSSRVLLGPNRLKMGPYKSN